MSDDDDVKLLEAWATGNRGAGQRLYRRYFYVVFRFFRSVDPSAAQDLTQQTMEQLIKSSGRFSGSGSFRSFVLGISYNVLRHHLRSRRRSRIDLPGDTSSCIDLGLGPLDLATANQEKKLLVKALRRISLRYQIVLELTYWEDMRAPEIAVVFGGKPHSTIREWRRQAKKALRAKLAELTNSDKRAESTMIGLETWADMPRLLKEASLGGSRVGDGRDGREPVPHE